MSNRNRNNTNNVESSFLFQNAKEEDRGSGIVVMTARHCEPVWRAIDDRICETLGARVAMRLGRPVDADKHLIITPLDEVAAHVTRARGTLRLLAWRAASLDAPPSFAAPISTGYLLCGDLASAIGMLEELALSAEDERSEIISIIPSATQRLDELVDRVRGLIIARGKDTTMSHDLRILLRSLRAVPRTLAAAVMTLASLA